MRKANLDGVCFGIDRTKQHEENIIAVLPSYSQLVHMYIIIPVFVS